MLQKIKSMVRGEKGQGTAEYVLLLVILIGLIITFKGTIKEKVGNIVNQISSGMDQAAE